MCASSLIKVDLEGKVLWQPDWPAGLNYTFNLAGFVIHGAIHEAKPDIHCVIHTHSLAGMAVAFAEEGRAADDADGDALLEDRLS